MWLVIGILLFVEQGHALSLDMGNKEFAIEKVGSARVAALDNNFVLPKSAIKAHTNVNPNHFFVNANLIQFVLVKVQYGKGLTDETRRNVRQTNRVVVKLRKASFASIYERPYDFGVDSYRWCLSAVAKMETQLIESFVKVDDFDLFKKDERAGSHLKRASRLDVGAARIVGGEGGGDQGEQPSDQPPQRNAGGLESGPGTGLGGVSRPRLLYEIIGLQAMLFGCLGAAIAFARSFLPSEPRKNAWTAIGTASLIGGALLFGFLVNGELRLPW